LCVAPSLHSPLHATGGTLLPVPMQLLVCVSPLCANWGRRGACCTTSGMGVALVHCHCVQEWEGGAKRGLPIPAWAPFLQPPLSHVPLPSLCTTGGTKKGVQAPSHSHRVPMLSLCSPWPSVPCKGGTKGVVCTPSPFLHAPHPQLPPSMHVANGVHGQTGGRGSI